MSLEALCQAGRAACSLDSGNMTDTGLAKQKTADLATTLGVKFLGERQPDTSYRSYREYRHYVTVNMERQRREAEEAKRDADKRHICRFFFLLLLLEAVFSWIIWKCCDKLWSDYKNRHNQHPSFAASFYAAAAHEPGVVMLSGIACDVHFDTSLPDEYGGSEGAD